MDLEHVSNFLGMYAIAVPQGKWLGHVVGALLCPERRQITALRVRRGLFKRDELILPTAAVSRVGEDVILVASIDAVVAGSAASAALGRDIIEWDGRPVITTSGARLGLLDEIDICDADWSIAALWFKDGGHVALQAGDVLFSDASVVVPDRYARAVSRRVRRSRGLWSRLFGGPASSRPDSRH